MDSLPIQNGVIIFNKKITFEISFYPMVLYFKCNVCIINYVYFHG